MKFSEKYKLYVTKQGLIYRLRNDKLVYVKPSIQNGYERVYEGLVHRIVWETFNSEIPQGYEIDHINNKLDDNRLDNLQLLTKSANLQKAHLGKKKSELTKRKISEAQKGRKNPWTVEYNKTRKFKQTNESKQKISESMKKRWREKHAAD